MHSAAPPKVREDQFPDTIPYSFLLELVVADPEVITELWAKQEGRERDEYALGALRLGILARRQARVHRGAAPNTAPHQDGRRFDDGQPASSESPRCAREDTPEQIADECLAAEPVAEDVAEDAGESVAAAGYEAATVACLYRRRRQKRSRFG
jgi:hypothetical protein